MKKIIVHDDESDPLKRYTEELNDLSSVRKDFEVIPLSKDEFSNEIVILEIPLRDETHGKDLFPTLPDKQSPSQTGLLQ